METKEIANQTENLKDTIMTDPTNSHSTFLIHILQVVVANTAALTITLANINQLLTTLSLTIATTYTIYKFFKEFKKDKNENKDENK